MNTFAVAYIALTVGAALGFLLASVLHSGSDADAPVRPEALTAEPRELVAVYEARREMDERMRDEGGRMKGEIKAWEKEKAKKRKDRR